MLFTCQDDPHSGNNQKQKQARQKGKDLNEAGISLELLHMGTSFDVNKFYKVKWEKFIVNECWKWYKRGFIVSGGEKCNLCFGMIICIRFM